jgi:hypothetical protein
MPYHLIFVSLFGGFVCSIKFFKSLGEYLPLLKNSPRNSDTKASHHPILSQFEFEFFCLGSFQG